MRFVAAMALTLLLAACASWAVVDGLAIIGTDKTLEDHVVSFSSGKNCSIVRTERGLTYCEEDQVVPVAPIFCYRTLGSVTCYDRPDPHRGRHQKVGENGHNFVGAR